MIDEVDRARRAVDAMPVELEMPNSLVEAVRGFISSEDLPVIRQWIADDPEAWHVPHHFGGGMQVRNFMRHRPECEGWGAHTLDDNWAEVVRRAVVL